MSDKRAGRPAPCITNKHFPKNMTLSTVPRVSHGCGHLKKGGIFKAFTRSLSADAPCPGASIESGDRDIRSTCQRGAIGAHLGEVDEFEAVHDGGALRGGQTRLLCGPGTPPARLPRRPRGHRGRRGRLQTFIISAKLVDNALLNKNIPSRRKI